MNKTTEALKLAEEAANRVIEALEYLKTIGIHPDSLAPAIRAEKKALAAIREALAEQEKQEPVAFVSDVHLSRYTLEWNGQPLPEGTKLYAAPVQPVKQDPVAYFLDVKAGCSSKPFYEQVPDEYKNDADVFPLYAAPVSAKREWVYLTDDEIDELIRKWYSPEMGLLDFAWAVIVALEEKNK